MVLDLNEAMYFTQVVRSGSFSQAAKQLGITKSKVSRKVQELEQRLGVSLLQRTTRSLRLTSAGEEYFQICAHSLDEIRDAEARVTQSQDSVRGQIRFSAAIDAGLNTLGSLVQEFLQMYPEVDLQLILSDAYVDLVQEGFDIALRFGELDDSSLIAKKLGHVEMGLFASPLYLKTHGTPQQPQDLSEHSCLGFLVEGALFPWVIRTDKTNRKIIPKTQFSSNNIVLLHQLTLSGVGIAYLPTFLCASHVVAGQLTPVLKQWRNRGDEVHLVYTHRKFVPKRVQVFSEFLISRLKGYFR